MRAALPFRFIRPAAIAIGIALAVSAAPALSAPGRDTKIEAPEAIAAAAEAFLRDQLSGVAGASGAPTVSVDAPRAANLPSCEKMVASLPVGGRMRPRVTVNVRCVAPQSWTTYVQANVSLPVQYYVAARPLAPGQTIGTADIQPQDGDLATLPPGALTDPAALVGMQASYRINAGRPILARNLRSPDSITRGQNVRIVARGNGFTITNEGEAMSTASPGGSVQVRTASGQTLTGIVRGPGEVEIPL